MDIQDFLEMFNNGELDVEKYFNNYETWFNILKKRGLMSEIDPHNASDNEVWQNEYLLWLYDNERENYYFWVEKFLDDIQIDEQTKKVFWIGDREDLSELFCSSRNQDVSQDTIRSILSDDGDWFNSVWDTTDNVYRDVIEELDKENLETLKNKVVELLSGKKLTPETEEMELIASEQGHVDFWEVDSENVSRIIDDEESMDSLFEDELSDVKSELYSIHSNSYNSAYEEQIYEEVWDELGRYFESKGEWIYVPHPYKKDTTISKYIVPIRDFEGFINDYLLSNKSYGNSGTIEYFGSYIGLLKEDKNCLSVRIPDYPDSRKIDRNINSYFKDYF